jgi:hypothetical protein
MRFQVGYVELRLFCGEIAVKTAEILRNTCGLYHQQRRVINKHSRQCEDDKLGVSQEGLSKYLSGRVFDL